MTSFYRFRSVDALLGDKKELSKQEIYFCPPAALNDPVEGYSDLFWRGDAIVWRNLLRHYLLCFMRAVSIAHIAQELYNPAIIKDFITGSPKTLPTPEFRNLFEQISNEFFNDRDIESIPNLLSENPLPLRRDDLGFILRGIHLHALNSIIKLFRKNNMVTYDQIPIDEESSKPGIAAVIKASKAIANDKGETAPDTLRGAFSAFSHVYAQIGISAYLHQTTGFSQAWYALLYEFPDQYIDQLSDLLFFDWYAACFVSKPNHAAMWGNYADGHKGVCLKFRAEQDPNDRLIMRLSGSSGFGGDQTHLAATYVPRPLPFEKMAYVDKFPEIDFFRSLGRIPMDELRTEWYTSASGQISEISDTILSQSPEWFCYYRKAFLGSATTKMKDWQHEDEYRLVLTSVMNDFSDPSSRKLRYDFSDLEEIIFGIRTPLGDKRPNH